MIKKIIYVISIICLIILTILTVDMLPFIFRSKTPGITFLILVLMLLLGELYALIKYNKIVKNSISYNLFLILTIMYLTLIYYKMYSSTVNVLYKININYLRNNYFLLSIVFIIILVDLFIMIKDYKKKEYV